MDGAPDGVLLPDLELAKLVVQGPWAREWLAGIVSLLLTDNVLLVDPLQFFWVECRGRLAGIGNIEQRNRFL